MITYRQSDPSKLKLIREIKKLMIDAEVDAKRIAWEQGVGTNHINAILGGRRAVSLERLMRIKSTVRVIMLARQK